MHCNWRYKTLADVPNSASAIPLLSVCLCLSLSLSLSVCLCLSLSLSRWLCLSLSVCLSLFFLIISSMPLARTLQNCNRTYHVKTTAWPILQSSERVMDVTEATLTCSLVIDSWNHRNNSTAQAKHDKSRQSTKPRKVLISVNDRFMTLLRGQVDSQSALRHCRWMRVCTRHVVQVVKLSVEWCVPLSGNFYKHGLWLSPIKSLRNKRTMQTIIIKAIIYRVVSLKQGNIL